MGEHHTQRIWIRLGFVVLPLATGAGLVAYIVARLSLLLGVALAATAGLMAAWTMWHRAAAREHRMIQHRVLIGLGAGLLATAAYDLSRYLAIDVFHLAFWPFDVFTIFGMLLVGESAPRVLQVAVGILFHYANGIGFALGFLFLFRRPSVLKGIAWAAVLELFMVSLYPGWLDIKVWDEFLGVSILGHTVYGSMLGGIARWALAREPHRKPADAKA